MVMSLFLSFARIAIQDQATRLQISHHLTKPLPQIKDTTNREMFQTIYSLYQQKLQVADRLFHEEYRESLRALYFINQLTPANREVVNLILDHVAQRLENILQHLRVLWVSIQHDQRVITALTKRNSFQPISI